MYLLYVLLSFSYTTLCTKARMIVSFTPVYAITVFLSKEKQDIYAYAQAASVAFTF